MKTLKRILVAASVLGMITACGEGFKAANQSSTKDGAPKTDPRQVNPEPTNSPSVFEQIVTKYGNELQASSQGDIDALDTRILAARVQMQIQDNGNDKKVDLLATLRLSCNDNDNREIEFNNLSWNDIVAGNTISTGMSDNGYAIRAICADSNCSEMVLIVKNAPGIVLLGMQQAFSNKPTQSSEVRRFDPMKEPAGLESYFGNALSIVDHRNDCSVQLDAFGGQGENVEQNNSNIPVDPTGGQFIEAPDQEEPIIPFWPEGSAL